MAMGREELKVVGWMFAIPLLLGAMGNGLDVEPRLVTSKPPSTATFYAHDTVNIRSGPSTMDDVVGQLRAGDAIEVEYGGSEWRKILHGPQAGAHVFTPALSSNPLD